MLNMLQRYGWLNAIVIIITWLPIDVLAHGVDNDTQRFLLQNTGVQIIPFLYIGAKHMITGYDHLLFLVGVLFFLYKNRDILLYISIFTVGHSLTLLLGVLGDIHINAYIIDAIIGLSIVYKAFDNLGGFDSCFGKSPNTKLAILIFGLFHGLGLATKLQALVLSDEGLIINLIAFNLGIELGQLIALAIILLIINCWRQYRSFLQFSTIANSLLMSAGFMLIGFQLTGYLIS